MVIIIFTKQDFKRILVFCFEDIDIACKSCKYIRCKQRQILNFLNRKFQEFLSDYLNKFREFRSMLCMLCLSNSGKSDKARGWQTSNLRSPYIAALNLVNPPYIVALP
jgi:hypothetical protein